MGNNAPCKGCKERNVDCHTTCEKYKSFKEKLKQVSKERYKENEERSFSIESTQHVIRKMRLYERR